MFLASMSCVSVHNYVFLATLAIFRGRPKFGFKQKDNEREMLRTTEGKKVFLHFPSSNEERAKGKENGELSPEGNKIKILR